MCFREVSASVRDAVRVSAFIEAACSRSSRTSLTEVRVGSPASVFSPSSAAGAAGAASPPAASLASLSAAIWAAAPSTSLRSWISESRSRSRCCNVRSAASSEPPSFECTPAKARMRASRWRAASTSAATARHPSKPSVAPIAFSASLSSVSARIASSIESSAASTDIWLVLCSSRFWSSRSSPTSRSSEVSAASGSLSPVIVRTSLICSSSRLPGPAGAEAADLALEKRERTMPSTSPSSRRERTVACTSAQIEGEHRVLAPKRPGAVAAKGIIPGKSFTENHSQ